MFKVSFLKAGCTQYLCFFPPPSSPGHFSGLPECQFPIVFQVWPGGSRASERAEAIMGGPLQSLRWLVEFLTARGEVLPSGALVIPGSPTELIPLDEDARVEAEITGVGRVVTAFRKAGLHPEG